MNYSIASNYTYLSGDYIITLALAFLSFVIGFVMICVWKSRKQNRSTLIWAVSLIFLSLNFFLRNVANTGDFNFLDLSKTFIGTFRWIFIALAMIGFYHGVIRLIGRKKLWKVYFPSIYFLIFFVLILFRTQLFDSASDFILIFYSAYVAPLSILIAIIFLMLYGVLHAENTRNNYGSLVIGLAWFILASRNFLVYWAVNNNFGVEILYVQAFGLIVLFIGLIVLNIETKEAFKNLEEDKKHHHHFN